MTVTTRLLLSALLVGLAGSSGVLHADDERSAKHTRNARLLERLLGAAGDKAPSEDDAAQQTLKTMHEIKERLDRRDIGKQTQDQQRQLVEHIDALIKNIRQGQGERRSIAGPPRTRPQPPGTEGKPSAAGTSGGSGQRKQGPADEATDEVGRSEAEAARLRQHRRLVKEVWGNLPPTLRQKMMNAYDEKTLPKYADLVRRYYEALAEPRDSRSK